MGVCTCFGGISKESPNTMNEAMLNSDSFSRASLKIFENEMGPEIKEIYDKCNSGNAHSITHIQIIDSQLGESGCEVLCRILPELKNLKEIFLKNNGIGCKGAFKISNCLCVLNGLERLTISENILTDEGLELICKNLPFSGKLKEINFSQNELTWVGAEYIRDVVGSLEKLEKIDLSLNEIGKRGIFKIANVLSGLKHLKEFKFDKEGLHPAEINAIKIVMSSSVGNSDS